MTDQTSVQDIQQIIEARAAAVRAGDIEGMMANVADDVVTFDVVNPLRRQGRDIARARAAEWVASYDGPIGYESRDVCVTADGDVAFSHGLSHVSGTLRTGNNVDMWFRSTLGFRRTGGRWMIAHDHGSVPFNPETGDASLTLKP